MAGWGVGCYFHCVVVYRSLHLHLSVVYRTFFRYFHLHLSVVYGTFFRYRYFHLHLGVVYGTLFGDFHFLFVVHGTFRRYCPFFYERVTPFFYERVTLWQLRGTISILSLGDSEGGQRRGGIL